MKLTKPRAVGLCLTVVAVIVAAASPATAELGTGDLHRVSQVGPYVPAGASNIVSASVGSQRQVAWTDGGRLFLQRLDSAGASLGPRILVAALPFQYSERESYWWGSEISMSIGGGRTLLSVPAGYDSGAVGGYFESQLYLVDTDDSVLYVGRSCSDDWGVTGNDPSVEPPPAVSAWNGTTFLVVGRCNSPTGSLAVSTVSATGTLTRRTQLSGDFGQLALSHLGTDFALAYSRIGPFGDLDIGAQRFTSAGAVAGSLTTVATGAGDQTSPTIAASGSQYLVAWVQPGSGQDLAGRTLTSSGGLGARRVLVNSTGNQTHPSVALAANGTWHLTWTDLRSGNNDVYGAHVTSAGALSPTNGQVVAGGAGAQRAPVVSPTSDGQAFISYLDGANGKTLALTAATAASGNARQATFDEASQSCEAIAAGHDQYLAVWQELRPLTGWNIYAQRLGLDGSRIGLTFPVSQAAGDQSCPRVAFGGSEWLVAWTDSRNASTGNDIYGATVSSSGTVAPSGGFPITTAAKSQTGVDVGYNGTNYLIGWTDLRNGTPDVYAARVQHNRTLLDGSGFGIATGSSDQTLRAVTGGLKTALVSWGRSGREVKPDKSFNGVARPVPDGPITSTKQGYTVVELTFGDFTLTGHIISEAAGAPTSDVDFGDLEEGGDTYYGPNAAAYDGSHLILTFDIYVFEGGIYPGAVSIDTTSPSGPHNKFTGVSETSAIASATTNASVFLTSTYNRLFAAEVYEF